MGWAGRPVVGGKAGRSGNRRKGGGWGTGRVAGASWRAGDRRFRVSGHAGKDRRGVARPVVPHWGCDAPGCGRLVFFRGSGEGCVASARREYLFFRGRVGCPFPHCRRGLRRRRGTRSEERRVGKECVSTCRSGGGSEN